MGPQALFNSNLLSEEIANQLFVDQSTKFESKSDKNRWTHFAGELEVLTLEMRESSGVDDINQIKRGLWTTRLLSLCGYAVSWIAPNPIAIILLGLSNYIRWSYVFHPISHGALDHVTNCPSKFKSKVFASGWRRYIDWLDWIHPKHWHIEHNILHHYYLGTDKDPDVVVRNTKIIRKLSSYIPFRYFVAISMISVWKLFYYAPNTLVESEFKKGRANTNKITYKAWSPFSDLGRKLWIQSILPYGFVKFVFIPLFFLPLGNIAVFYVFMNTILAEIFANIFGFATIATNHTGKDILSFEGRPSSKADFYIRQIVGTINFKSNSQFSDFLYGGMNYQIEHHIWPNFTIRQYRKVSPRLKELCIKYGIPYREEPLLKRFFEVLRVITSPDSDFKLPKDWVLK